MKVIPRLNINKHPSECTNGSLINAINMMVSTDNAVLQSEPDVINHAINILLKNAIKSNFKIKHIIPCNKELILFIIVEGNNNFIDIYRYNETNKKLIKETKTDYNGGDIVGTFTYNLNNLIIAFSEVNEDINKKQPLKIINLGNIDDDNSNNKQLTNYKLHPICPEVKLPFIQTTYKYGNAYKGWYYIFIRYKISDNTHTQWFNTNESVFIDNFNNNTFFNYFISSELQSGVGNTYTASNIISDNKDISSLSFNCEINNLDFNYNSYQLGFICISKSYTKCFKTNDILITNNIFNFNSSSVVDYGIENIIKTYYNYFNIKTLTTQSNRLYIANYIEDNNEKNISKFLKLIKCNIKLTNTDTSTLINKTINKYVINVKGNSTQIKGQNWKDDPNAFIYFTGKYIVANVSIIEEYEDGRYENREYISVQTYNDDEILTISLHNKSTDIIKDVKIKAKDVIISPFEKEAAIYFYNGNSLTKITDTIVDIKVNDKSIAPKNDSIAWFIDSGIIYEKFNISEIDDADSSIEALNRLSNFPNQPYNFFIHFIDKYGNITQGFNINNFDYNISHDSNVLYSTIVNKLNNLIIIPILLNIPNNFKISIKLNIIPSGYIGYFISYEKLEKSIKYSCVSDKDSTADKLILYSDEFNYSDNIDLNFDKIDLFDTTIKDYPISSLNRYYNISGGFNTLNVIDKKIVVADSYDNISKSTSIILKIEKVSSNYNNCICRLYKSIDNNFYTKENKILIPCSKITYDVNDVLNINTKTGFISSYHASIYTDKSYYNDTLKAFQKQNSPNIINDPLINAIWIDYSTTMQESIQYNNKPNIIFFPNQGLNETDEKKKSFVIGNIVEAKNSIDLYQQKQVPIYALYPKAYFWYNPNINYTNEFPKTIRRSNVIQDESQSINWRYFETEQYKNIVENKGVINKLISIGYYFIAHTEHSMFLFNATDTIKSDNNGIQLANVDIWDINYKEIITSNLGFAGIQKEHSGIVGEFGYVFYDDDSKRIYRYDNNKLDYIDSDINNFIKNNNIQDITLADDKERNRIIFTLKTNLDCLNLTYNYKTNTFISIHFYNADFIVSTKNNIYFVNNNSIKNFDSNSYKFAQCDVIINTQYSIVKYIEYITYKLKEFTGNKTDFNLFPVEEYNKNYAGNVLSVYNDNCNTGEIDITIRNNELNSVDKFDKPYYELGNWNYNLLRDNYADYKEGVTTSDKMSRIYGNWFVTSFIFNTHKKIEFEDVDVQLVKD